MSHTRISGAPFYRDADGNIKPWNSNQLTFPTGGTAAKPDLAFGDGDSGLFESTDDILSFTTGGFRKIYLDTAGGLFNNNAGRWGLLNESPTATNPIILVNKDDVDTGIGSGGADQLSLIAGGVEGIRIAESAGNIVNTITGITADKTMDTNTGGAAVSTDTAITMLETTGIVELALGDGVEGQDKYVVMTVDNGDVTIRPAHMHAGATLVFDAVGDSFYLKFIGGAWMWVGGRATLGW